MVLKNVLNTTALKKTVVFGAHLLEGGNSCSSISAEAVSVFPHNCAAEIRTRF